MLNFNRACYTFLASVAIVGLSACANKSEKTDILASTNPAQEISKLEQKFVEAQSEHTDILANREYNKAKNHFEDAKKAQKKNKKQEDILKHVAYSTTYLEDAQSLANGRRQGADSLLNARSEALNAGAFNTQEGRKELAKLDKKLIKASEDLRKNLSADEAVELERAYLSLQVKGIQETNLNKARSNIEASIKDGAEKRAPNTLRKAQVDISSAENTIANNSTTPSAYEDSVRKANESAQFLVDVTNKIKNTGKNTTEAVAIQLVQQERRIGNLQTNLGRAEGNLNVLGRTVAAQGTELASAQAAVNLQETIESARKEFRSNEADVYQQGNQLVFRLKSMKFPSGRSELSQESLDTLAKVNQIIDGLPVAALTVEGHTDSTGTADINQKLSQQRAEAVAKYLENNISESTEISAVGYSFEKPIASNRSREGRAQNRRVDVIVNVQ